MNFTALITFPNLIGKQFSKNLAKIKLRSSEILSLCHLDNPEDVCQPPFSSISSILRWSKQCQNHDSPILFLISNNKSSWRLDEGVYFPLILNKFLRLISQVNYCWKEIYFWNFPMNRIDLEYLTFP